MILIKERALMPFINLADVKEREIVPGLTAKMIHSENMTLVFWDVRAGSSLPHHSHTNEQITTVTKGTFQFTIEGETKIIEPGFAVIIPSNAKHHGKAITDCQLIDVFYPAREDYR